MDYEKQLLKQEEQFLAAYRLENYDRPSVATDIAVFSMYGEKASSHRKDAKPKLSVLLIKRGEHPFLNQWALPGGFLRADETVEACAFREIEEETGCIPVSLLPVGVFSEPNRDPRGRIVSNAFVSVLSDETVRLRSGHDSVAAKWFDVSFKPEDGGHFHLELTHGSETLRADLRENRTRVMRPDFEIISNTGLAFDHARIIASALTVLKAEAENLDIAFEFLPEKFTLAALQMVQETLLGISLLKANFRRKIAEYVEETDEYTEGAGHRPARLFRKK